MKTTNQAKLLFCVFMLLAIIVSSASAEKARTWSDKSGRFEVEAIFLKQEKDQVQLKKSDGRVVTVPISALSESDQNYLKELQNPAVNPFAGGDLAEPAIGSTAASSRHSTSSTSSDTPSNAGLALLKSDEGIRELTADGPQVFLQLDTDIPPLEPDPSPQQSEFHKFAVPIGKLDAYAKVSQPVLIDPDKSVYAVSTNRVANAVADESFGRIYLVSHQSKQPQIAIDIEQTLVLLDHHVQSGRTLAVFGVGSNTERGGDLILIDKLATGSPQVLARWHVPEWNKPGFKPKVEFGRMLDADTAFIHINREAYVWNLQSGELAFKMEDLGSSSKIQLSPGGRYLAVPDSKCCRLVDIQKAELLGKVPFSSTLTPAVCFSPNGQFLAMVGGNQHIIWDLKGAKVHEESAIGTASGRLVGWVDNKYLLTQLGGLVDLSLQMPLWTYSLPSGDYSKTIPGGVVMVQKDHRMSMVVCLPLPHERVAAVAKQLPANDSNTMAIQPGTEIALRVDAVSGVDPDVIKAGLREAVEQVGWRVSDTADIEITAKIEQGEKQTLYFRQLGSFSLRGGETVTIRPYIASVKVTQRTTTLWSRRATAMVPLLIQMKPGQSVKQAVKQYEKADPEYFKRMALPPRILKPELAKSIGRSAVKNGNWYDYN